MKGLNIFSYTPGFYITKVRPPPNPAMDKIG